MRNICINVSPLIGRITGIERCIYENIKRIDEIAVNENLNISIIYPFGTTPNLPTLKYIKRVELAGNGSKIEICAIRKYLKKTKSVYVSIHGGLCLYKGAVVCTNDIRTWVSKEYDPLPFRLKCNINVLSSKLFASKIVTISETAATEISNHLKIPRSRISIISPGWEHIKEVEPDITIWDRIRFASKGEYYYSLSSRAPHKNFKWVKEVAKRNPNEVFLVAGKVWDEEKDVVPGNLHYLGYITDEENVELMRHCKAFLHPSKYEGFGMTPLEALACGAKIIISNASCLPEVFEDCAVYFDPDDYNVDLNKMIACVTGPSDKLLKKYSWDKSAKMWIKLMKEVPQL